MTARSQDLLLSEPVEKRTVNQSIKFIRHMFTLYIYFPAKVAGDLCKLAISPPFQGCVMVVSQTLLLAVASARRLPGASSSVVSVWNFPTTSDPPPQASWGIRYQLARAPGSFFDALSRRTVYGALLRMSVLLHSNLAISNSVNS